MNDTKFYQKLQDDSFLAYVNRIHLDEHMDDKTTA